MSEIGLAEHLATFVANWHIAQTRSASPLWQAAALGMFLLVVGLALELSGLRQSTV